MEPDRETWTVLITHEIMNPLDEINQRGKTVIVVTHSRHEMVAEMNKKKGLLPWTGESHQR